MVDKIGENAGKVYSYLQGRGTVAIKDLVRGTGLKSQEADRAIGWLAREGKVRWENCRKDECLSLTE